MRNRIVLIATIVLVTIAGSSASIGGASADRREIQPQEPIAGVTGGAIGDGQPEAVPGYTLSLRRATFEPGGYVSLHHHAGGLILYVESGELTYPISEGEVEVVRAADEGTPAPTERFGPGDEPVLGVGDWLFEQGVVHSARNDGDEPTVVWLSALVEESEDFTLFHEAEGTPPA